MDGCIYRGEVNGEEVLLTLYVNDGLLATKKKKTVDIVLDNLKKDFKVPVGKVWRSQENEKTNFYKSTWISEEGS